MAGARKVFGTDVADSRLELLPQSPAVVGLNPRTADLVKNLKEHNHGRLADVVFEVKGDPALIPGQFEVLRREGRLVVLSSPRGATSIDFHDLCNFPGFAIVGAHEMTHPAAETPENPWTHRRHFELFFDLIAAGGLQVSSLVRNNFSYLSAAEVYSSLLADRSRFMAVTFDWKSDSGRACGPALRLATTEKSTPGSAVSKTPETGRLGRATTALQLPNLRAGAT